MKYLMAAFGVLILATVAIFVIATSMHRGKNSSSSSTSKITKARSTKLLDYSGKDATLSVTTQGTLVGDEQRRAVRINIDPQDRSVEILAGYDEVVISSQHYRNTREAYENFIRAANYAGFTYQRVSTISDPRGVCPFGNTFKYTLVDNHEPVTDLWGVSCSAKLGNFAGNGPSLRQLFQNQIPDYNTFVSGVQL